MARRGFLGRAVAALAAGAAVNVTEITASRASAETITEHPALLEASERLDALSSEWRTADALRLEARAFAEKLVPPVPDEIVVPRDSPFWACCTDDLRDVEGRAIKSSTMIIDSQLLTQEVDDGRLYASKRSKFGKKVHAMIKTAQKYEAERDAAIIQSGVLGFQHQAYWIAFEIKSLARDVAEIEPLTMRGVAVLARFQCAFEALEDDHEKRFSAQIMGPPLARAVARLTQGSAS